MKLSWFSLPRSLPPPPAAWSLVPAALPFACSAGTVRWRRLQPCRPPSVSRLFLCMSIFSAQHLSAAIQTVILVSGFPACTPRSSFVCVCVCEPTGDAYLARGSSPLWDMMICTLAAGRHPILSRLASPSSLDSKKPVVWGFFSSHQLALAALLQQQLQYRLSTTKAAAGPTLGMVTGLALSCAGYKCALEKQSIAETEGRSTLGPTICSCRAGLAWPISPLAP